MRMWDTCISLADSNLHNLFYQHDSSFVLRGAIFAFSARMPYFIVCLQYLHRRQNKLSHPSRNSSPVSDVKHRRSTGKIFLRDVCVPPMCVYGGEMAMMGGEMMHPMNMVREQGRQTW